MLIACFVGILSKPLMVAFSCRFYNQPGSDKTSYHQIYLSDVHGKDRKQLTFDRSEKLSVKWVGKTKLSWIQTFGVTKEETWNGYHVPLGGRELRQLVLYDIPTKQRRVLHVGQYDSGVDLRGVQLHRRGRPFYVEQLCGRKSQLEISNGKLIRCYHVRPNLQTDLQANPEEHWKNYAVEVKEKETLGSERLEYEISRNGKQFVVPGLVDYVWDSEDRTKIWFQETDGGNSAGYSQSITEIDWKQGIARVIANDIFSIDFRPEEPYWASVSNQKCTFKLGSKWVWQSELWCGDVRTGKQWKIASDAVHGDSVSVQPR
jgi:hypothetical protein